MKLEYEINQADWESYQKKLAQYISLSKTDVGTILAKKTDSIRIKILKALTKYAPSKAELYGELKQRNYRTRLTGNKAIQTANVIYPHKELYRSMFAAEGIRFDKDTLKLTPKMMSRTLAVVKEMKSRTRASRYHASTWSTPKIPQAPTQGTITATSNDGQNVLTMDIQTSAINPSVLISNRAPRIAELIYGNQILQGILKQEESDMETYITRKLSENKNKTNL